MFHCVWGSYTDSERAAVLAELASAGIKWVRIDVSWASIEDSRKGARNAGYLQAVDQCVDASRQRGMSVLLQLWQTPAWANGSRGVTAPPTNAADFGDFAAWIAARYRGKVSAWELWNEANNSMFWSGSVAEYAGLVKAGYRGFKAGDSSAPVLLGGLMYNDDKYLQQLYANGAKGSFDIVATHPYQGRGDEPPERADDGNVWWFTHLPAVRAVMAQNGDGSKPIWFTEWGWSAHDNGGTTPDYARGVTEAQQADFAARALNYVAANWPGVGVMFWYKERSWSNATSDPPWLQAHLEGYGLLRADRSERPVYAALRRCLTGR